MSPIVVMYLPSLIRSTAGKLGRGEVTLSQRCLYAFYSPVRVCGKVRAGPSFLFGKMQPELGRARHTCLCDLQKYPISFSLSDRIESFAVESPKGEKSICSSLTSLQVRPFSSETARRKTQLISLLSSFMAPLFSTVFSNPALNAIVEGKASISFAWLQNFRCLLPCIRTPVCNRRTAS